MKIFGYNFKLNLVTGAILFLALAFAGSFAWDVARGKKQLTWAEASRHVDEMLKAIREPFMQILDWFGKILQRKAS